MKNRKIKECYFTIENKKKRKRVSFQELKSKEVY